MKRLSLRRLFVCGIVLSLAWASPLFSQQEDISTLRQKNAALEAKVKELEALLKQHHQELFELMVSMGIIEFATQGYKFKLSPLISVTPIVP